ncbi:MAG TPA: nitroreductase [Actinomycetota bacterium]|nr:nitroreductase [Actinomycetota bacterium]
MQTYEAILTRRSVPKVTQQEPTREQIEKLLAAAVRAPNHHLTQPWRFIVLRGEALREFGDAWGAGEARLGKNADAARTKALRAPVIICVIERPKTDHAIVVEVEEHHATGAAIQNILLAAHDMGLGAMIRTGVSARLEEVRDYLGLEDDELVAGFIYLGFPPEGDSDRPMSRRRPASEVTEWRGWA